MLSHFLNPPNWFTSASILCSTLSLTILVGADDITAEVLTRCSVLVIFGTVFDLMDGRVARLTNRWSEFGVQLDSIADIIGFGVAPALLVWAWQLHELGLVGALLAFWYVLATAFRLARFNVEATHGSKKMPGHSVGLTSTMAGFALVSWTWTANGYMAEFVRFTPWVVGMVVAAIGLLMVSSIPFRTFRDMRQNRNARLILAIALALTLTGALVLDASMWFLLAAGLYLSWGLVDGVFVAYALRRHGLIDDDELETSEA